VQSSSFAEADLDTALIEREHDALFAPSALGLPCAVAGVAAHLLAAEAKAETADPWSRRDGFRLHGGATRQVPVRSAAGDDSFELQRAHDGATTLVWRRPGGDESGNPQWPWRAHPLGAGRYDVTLGTDRWTLSVHAIGESFTVFGPQGSLTVQQIDALAHSGDTGSHAGSLAAPMPGKVVSFAVKVGDAVTAGQAVAVMEAMKMEHTLAAPRAGTVAELLYAPGDQVGEGAELLRLS
jgi:3-methylcrotonyl-CoA carboxylase alpha subunit